METPGPDWQPFIPYTNARFRRLETKMAQLDDDVTALQAADAAEAAQYAQDMADIQAEIAALKGQVPDPAVLANLEGVVANITARTAKMQGDDPGAQPAPTPPPPPSVLG